MTDTKTEPGPCEARNGRVYDKRGDHEYVITPDQARARGRALLAAADEAEAPEPAMSEGERARRQFGRDLVREAIELAVKDFDAEPPTNDGLFTAAGFSRAFYRTLGMNGVLDGYVVRAILSGRPDVAAEPDGAHYRVARALLATEPEPLTEDEIGDVVGAYIKGAGSERSDWSLYEFGRAIAAAQRRKTRPAQPEPAPVKAPPMGGKSYLDECLEDPKFKAVFHAVEAKETADRLAVFDKIFDAYLSGSDDWHVVVGGILKEFDVGKSVPPDPPPAPSPETDTPALEAWQREEGQGPWDDLREAFMSDLARATQALRERAEKDLDRDVTQPLLERAGRLERERDDLRAKLAKAVSIREADGRAFAGERAKWEGRLSHANQVAAALRSKLAESETKSAAFEKRFQDRDQLWQEGAAREGRLAEELCHAGSGYNVNLGGFAVDEAIRILRELSAENARLRGQAGKAGLPELGTKVLVLAPDDDKDMAHYRESTVKRHLFIFLDEDGRDHELGGEGIDWKRIPVTTNDGAPTEATWRRVPTTTTKEEV